MSPTSLKTHGKRIYGYVVAPSTPPLVHPVIEVPKPTRPAGCRVIVSKTGGIGDDAGHVQIACLLNVLLLLKVHPED